MEEEKELSTIQKLGTFGGKIHLNQKLKGLYTGTKNLSKEKLFGAAGCGPLHPGMAYNKAEMAVSSVESDTRSDLVQELVAKGLTRREAIDTIKSLIKEGVLVEEYSPDLKKKVLVFQGG